MGKAESILATGEQNAPEKESDDESLLEAIAFRGDRSAFAALFKRYEKAAYSLAIHLTGRSHLAEEAVQESMLRIWLSASSYRRGGNARGWIFRIIARESLKTLKKTRREHTPMNSEHDVAAAEHAAADSMASGEQLTILRRVVEKLPALERRILTLYYGCELSQEEIGAALDMPQRVVSRRLKETLDSLRVQASKAGLAATLPAFNWEGLGHVVRSAYSAPPEFSARVLEQVTRPPRPSMRESMRHLARAKSTGMGVMVGGMVLAAAGVGWFALLPSESSSQPAGKAPPESVLKLQAAPPPSKRTPLHAAWHFTEGPDPTLQVIEGTWSWKATEAKGGAMLVPTDQELVVLLPCRIPAAPCVVTSRMLFGVPGHICKSGANWMVEGQDKTNRAWYTRTYRTVLPTQQTGRTYFVGRYILDTLDGELKAIREFEKPYPSDRIFFYAKNHTVLELEIQELTLNELPEDYRDPALLLKNLDLSHWISDQGVPDTRPTAKPAP